MLSDTITAISTPVGVAGIAIIRISGPKAKEIIKKVFVNKNGELINNFKSYQLRYGFIVDPDNRVKIDEVLVSYMKGPYSFTAEDIIEINCHGGLIPSKKILEIVLKLGARHAEPGEFSKRAFLNGRIDLAQAESIIDAINAKTETGLKVAITQLEGKLSKKVNNINQSILELLAFIEAGIDFPEEDLEELSIKEIKNRSENILVEMDKLLKTADTGKLFRDGIRTAIIGKPNVGKSSLLNSLLRESRAIVTDIPGTTRDVIEEIINIEGVPLKIIDTAGIRETEDLIEKMGVEKAKKISANSDLILFVVDAVQGLLDEDKKVLNLLEGKKSIIIINKIDLVNDDLKNIYEVIIDKPIVEISAKEEIGIEKLEKQIIDLILNGQVEPSDNTLISNIRHKNSLERAREHIKEVIHTIEMDMPTDCMSIDLKGAWECLGEISGETLGEDIIDKIFSEFCIGK